MSRIKNHFSGSKSFSHSLIFPGITSQNQDLVGSTRGQIEMIKL